MGALRAVARSTASAPIRIPSKRTAGASTPPTRAPFSRAESIIFRQKVVFPHPGEPVINVLMSHHHLDQRFVQNRPLAETAAGAFGAMACRSTGNYAKSLHLEGASLVKACVASMKKT
jgi:hypothetical protein